MNIGPLPEQLRTQEHEAIVASVNSYIDTHHNPNGTIGPLRPEQTTTFYRFRDFLAEGHSDTNNQQALASLACSYGKTALLACAADAMGAGQPRVDGKKRQVAIVTSRDILLGQMTDDTGLRKFAPNVPVTKYNQDTKDATGGLVVSSYQSIPHANSRGDIAPGQMSSFLLDEVHNVGRIRSQILKRICQGAIIFGVSASAGIAEKFFPRVIDTVTMGQGVMEYGFLCGMRFYGAQTGIAFEAHINSRGDYKSRDTKPLADNERRNQLIVDTARFCIETMGPGIISCIPGKSQAHAFAIADLLRESGDITDLNGVTRPIEVEGLGTSRRTSKRVGEDFRQGKGDVLTQIRFLEEGYDAARIRWAILARPTCSLHIVTQLLGRGGRNDGKDKLFTAIELIDEELLAPHKQKHLWDVFNLPLEQGIIIDKRGIGREGNLITGGSWSAAPPNLPTHLLERERVSADEQWRLYFEAFAEPLQEEKPTEGLFTMCEETGLNYSWAQRILFFHGLSARLNIDEHGQPEPHFKAEARAILEEEVASEGHVTLTMASAEMQIGKGPIIDWIREDGLTLAKLHTYNAGVLVKLPHFTAEQYAAFKAKHGIRHNLPSERIRASEVRKVTKSNQTSLGNFFSLRGFSVTTQAIKGKSGRPQTTFLRSEMEPWLAAFQQATPVPDTGFSQLYGYSIRNYEHRQPTIEELFTVASLVRLPLHYFTTQANRRVEYIADHYHADLMQALADYIADPDAFTSTGAPLYEIYDPNKPIAPLQPLREATAVEPPESPEAIVEEVKEQSAPKPPSSASAPSLTPAQPSPRFKQVRRPIRPVAREYKLDIAETLNLDIAVTACTAAHRLSTNSLVSLPTLGTTQQLNAINLSRFAAAQTHTMPTLLALASRLPNNDNATDHIIIGEMHNGDIGASRPTFAVIEAALRKHGASPLPVPYTWSFCDDIARYLRMDIEDLRQSLLKGNIGESHLRGMFIEELRDSLLFCSPGLTRQILNYHLRATLG